MNVPSFIKRATASAGVVLSAAIVLIGAALFNPAAATLMSASDATFGANSVTQDDATGLEWLDVTVSVGRSFNDVSGQFGAGGDFEGWRYATTADVITFFDNAGVRDSLLGLTGHEFLAPKTTFDPLVAAFLDLTGRTSVFSNTSNNQSLFADDPSDALAGSAYVADAFGVSAGTLPQSVIQENRFSAAFLSTRVGSYLVRNFNNTGGTTDVPEPGSLALFGFGLIGLGMARRRKRRA